MCAAGIGFLALLCGILVLGLAGLLHAFCPGLLGHPDHRAEALRHRRPGAGIPSVSPGILTSGCPSPRRAVTPLHPVGLGVAPRGPGWMLA